MVLWFLRGASSREHSYYLGRRTRIPLRLPSCKTRTQEDKICPELQRDVPKPDKQAVRHNLWILMETWRLIDKRVSARRELGKDQRRIRRLGRAIRAVLKEERRRRVVTAVEYVERLMNGDPPFLCEAWRRIQGWYRAAVDHAPLSA